MNKTLRATVSSILLGAATVGAHAQELNAQDADDSGSSAERQDTVIVTGTRSAKAVDKIPGAITVVSPAELQRTVTLTQDATAVLARSVPGYAESSQALNTIGETLRG